MVTAPNKCCRRKHIFNYIFLSILSLKGSPWKWCVRKPWNLFRHCMHTIEHVETKVTFTRIMFRRFFYELSRLVTFFSIRICASRKRCAVYCSYVVRLAFDVEIITKTNPQKSCDAITLCY
jgi:hypothetical protein